MRWWIMSLSESSHSVIASGPRRIGGSAAICLFSRELVRLRSLFRSRLFGMRNPVPRNDLLRPIPMLLFCVVVGLSHSSVTEFWVTSAQEDLLESETHNVTVNSQGKVSIAPELRLVADSKEKFVWCVASDRNGNTYIGTGDEGKVFKFSGTGLMELFCDFDEPEVLSLLFRHPYLYAGVGPTGIVYRVGPKGKVDKFFETEQKYVWDIFSDSESGIYVATGEEGKIFRVPNRGEVELVYESVDSHITRLRGYEGSLYATTSGSGRVYAIPEDGNPSVVYQTKEEEILAFEIDKKGILWVGANSEDCQSRSVYRIDLEGTAQKIWSCPDSLIYSFAFRGDRLLVGTGNQGKIYEVDAGGNVSLLTKCDDSAVLSLVPSGGVWIGTGNLGRLYMLEEVLAEEGILISETYDTEGISNWGHIDWKAETESGTSIDFFTRTGNSKEVDDTWSDWASAYTRGARIESPEARFIQWKALLLGTSRQSPVLKEVKIPYRQKNMAPKVDKVIVEDDPGAKMKKITWEASDPNGDSLLCDLHFKGEEEKKWKLLEDDLVGTEYDLESMFFPDGVYVIRISAKDSPQNPQSLVLTGEDVSRPFRVDNTSPKVIIQSVKGEGKKLRIKAKVVDEVSPIRSCHYSIDAGEFRCLAPNDGIFDSEEESFSFLIEETDRGEHLLVIKGEDEQGNLSMARKVVTIP